MCAHFWSAKSARRLSGKHFCEEEVKESCARVRNMLSVAWCAVRGIRCADEDARLNKVARTKVRGARNKMRGQRYADEDARLNKEKRHLGFLIFNTQAQAL